MKRIVFAIFLIQLFGCGQSVYFDRNYYEHSSGIKFPPGTKLVATHDNGVYVTVSILDLDKSVSEKFIRENKFHPWKETYAPQLGGLFYLDSNYRELPAKEKLFFRKKR